MAVDLATCVAAIATWSLSNVPRFLAGEHIQKILGSCDRETAIGKRDYALLLLLARLGLRAGEVVALALDDFDWEAGLVTVRGKGKRVAQMPLPRDHFELSERLVDFGARENAARAFSARRFSSRAICSPAVISANGNASRWARAILRQTPIVILDEPTSAMKQLGFTTRSWPR